MPRGAAPQPRALLEGCRAGATQHARRRAARVARARGHDQQLVQLAPQQRARKLALKEQVRAAPPAPGDEQRGPERGARRAERRPVLEEAEEGRKP